MSRRPAKHWPLRRRQSDPPPVDLYAAGSDSFASRSRVYETTQVNGTVVVSIGAPPTATAGEPRARLRKANAVQRKPAAPEPEAASISAPISTDPPKEPETKPGLGKRT